ncbi:ATP-grasp domain-containing protein [Streptomyces antimicrobicus]|uniref:ATP-grasp domain-containing protein n=1 Tax=Streptomyces antimicrobicus TaxID=2883108 RepID=A0ABS8B184_9ACTN|nr:ATP-grasp domain-containing protein [Streptomyces antimicrobicus]MCB5178355.1 ATP-grasp domain-containing protein [Streptomyces antimicrobicus]
MTLPDPSVAAEITHVLVGYSPVMLGKLDAALLAGSVLVVEEPEVIAARGIEDLVGRHRCVGALVAAPSQDEEHPQRVVAAVPRPPRVRAVVPVVEYGVVAAAALAEAWGLPGAGPKAARVLRDKALLRETVAGTDLAQPAWARARRPQDVEDFRARYGGACVLKPAARQASLGVQLLDAGDDTAAAWAHTTTADEATLRAGYPDGGYLVEQRLRGPEVSVEAVVHDGVVGFTNITAKLVQDSRHPVEVGHTVPAALPEGTSEALRGAVQVLVDATGFRSGVLHSEWILDGGRPHLVECAGRLPGGGITVLIDLAYTTDILADLLGVLDADDPRPAPPRRASAGAAVRFLTAPAGLVTDVHGAAEARTAPGVHELHLAVAPGHTVEPVTSSWQRAGFVIATGAHAAEAARRAEYAASRVTLRTVAEGGAER